MPIQKLYLELTSSCNLDCAFCYRRAWNEGPADMNEHVFSRVLHAVRDSDSIQNIVLGGIGEPTAAPLFMRALTSFPGNHITVTTNGINIPQSGIDAMAEQCASVVFSVDGLAENFSSIRGCTLESVLESVRKLRSAKKRHRVGLPQLSFQFVLGRNNAEDLPGVIELAGREGINSVYVSHLLPQDETNADNILYARYTIAQAAALYERVRLKAMRHGISVFLPPLELKTERHCLFAENNSAYICANGDIAPCYRFSHAGTEFVMGRKKTVLKYSFGNIAAQNLAEIYDGQSFTHFRKGLQENRYPSCPDCDFLDGCDLALDTTADCWSGTPSCSDCMWARGFLRCP